MKEETYEINADSLQAARDKAKDRIPEGFYLHSERVLSEGKPVTLKESAENSESAFVAARERVPAGAQITTEREVRAPELLTLRLSSDSEASARKQAESETDKTSVLKSVSLAMTGKKGFLGIGRTQNQYDIHILKKTIVEVTYKTDAKIVVTVGDQIDPWSALLSDIKDAKSTTEIISKLEELAKLNNGQIIAPTQEVYFSTIVLHLMVAGATRHGSRDGLGYNGRRCIFDNYTLPNGTNIFSGYPI